MPLRRLGLAALAAALLALAGCGGSETIAPEVPSPYADAPIPESPDAPPAASSSPSSDDTSSSDSSTDSSPSATATPDAGTTDSSGATGSTGTTGGTSTGDQAATGGTTTGTGTASAGGGAAAPDSGEDSATNDTAPPAGSNAEKFEDFCAQNPGAC